MDQPATPSGNGKLVRKQIGILGTGQFGSAIAQRLLTNGYSVVFGSRTPQRRCEFLASKIHYAGDVRVTTLEDCITSNDVIIVALRVDHFEETFTPELCCLCAGKTLVDVSNRKNSKTTTVTAKRTTSNTEFLASLASEAITVKAFNSIPAYVMENDVTAGGTRMVTVASDDVTARAAVCVLARELGFEAYENGVLTKAGWMEERERKTFPDWRMAFVATSVLLLFWLVFAVSRFYIADDKLRWDQLPLKVINKVFGAATLSLLSLTYFPSTCAACVQIVYGTKYRHFPGWLDTWLKSRKQLGLMAFAVISVHAVISALILSPTYMSAWFMKDVFTVKLPSNLTQDIIIHSRGIWMTWIGELSLLVAVLAYVLMALLAVTSLPSVTNSLHWSEWRFLHSRLGCVMLTLAVMHVYVMGVPKWMKTGFPLVLFRVKFMSIVLPTMVLVSRLVFLLPCLSSYLKRIRMGWERKPPAAKGDLLNE